MIGVCRTISAESVETLVKCVLVDALQIGIGAQRDLLDVLGGGWRNLITESFNSDYTELTRLYQPNQFVAGRKPPLIDSTSSGKKSLVNIAIEILPRSLPDAQIPICLQNPPHLSERFRTVRKVVQYLRHEHEVCHTIV